MLFKSKLSTCPLLYVSFIDRNVYRNPSSPLYKHNGTRTAAFGTLLLLSGA